MYSAVEKRAYYQAKIKDAKTPKQKKAYISLYKKVDRKVRSSNVKGHLADLSIEVKDNKYAKRHLDAINSEMSILFPNKKSKKVRK